MKIMKNYSGGGKNAAPAKAAGLMRSNAGVTPWRQILKSRAEKYTIWLVLLVLIGIGALSSEFFLKPSNLLNVLRQVSNLGFLSVGMTFVILSAGIDLSVGSIIGLTSIVVAMLMPQGPWLAIPAAMGSGMTIGFLSGLGVTVGRMPPFIVTLGMLSIARGLALFISQGQVIEFESGLFEFLGGGRIGGVVPFPPLVFLTVVALAAFVLKNTVFGRNVYAVGANEEAARLSGVNINRVKMMVYLICGTLSAVGGLFYASLLSVGNPTGGQGSELDAIAAVVIGGTSLFGGSGNMFGTLAGVLIMGAINNILNLNNVSPYVQQLAKGVIILAAVYIDYRRKGR
jgi:ribose/xylose/arabinose/galactoside ABC-type transport system permease subunit